MKNIVLIPNNRKDADLSVTKRTAKTLSDSGAAVYISKKFEKEIGENYFYYEELPSSAQLIAVIGGDGSVLDAAVVAIERDIPIVGINLGNVGYLSEIEPDAQATLAKIVSDEYYIYEKMLLSVEKISASERISSERLAVNDIVISHDSYLGISEFTVSTAEGGLKYRADGIILSTPAGSTAYSFSAGGPIVSHEVDAILATPVCPHSFFDRSILFDIKNEISVKNTGKNNLNISVDGRCFTSLLTDEVCVIKASTRKLKMLSFEKNNMFSRLFEKMRVMEDVK